LSSSSCPIAGSLHGKGQSYELARTYQVLTKWVFAVTVPVFFILFLFPKQPITLLFGERFNEAGPVLRILSAALLFHSFWGPNGIIMVVIGMSREIAYVSSFGAALSIVLNYLMISFYALGIVGAAFASTGTYISLNILVSAIIYRKTGFHPITAHYIKAILCAALMGFAIDLVSGILPQYPWIVFLYFFIYCFGYTILLIVTHSFGTEDISLFKTIIETAKTKGRELKESISRTV